MSHQGNNPGSALTGKCQHAPAGEFAHPSCSSIPTPALGEPRPITIKAVCDSSNAKLLLVYRIYVFTFSLYLKNGQDTPSCDQQTFRNTHTSHAGNDWNYWLISLKPDCLLALLWKGVQDFFHNLIFSYLSWCYYFKNRTKNGKTQRQVWIYCPEKICSLNFVLGGSRNPILLYFLSVIFPGRCFKLN